MMQVFLEAANTGIGIQEPGKPPWLEVLLVLIPTAATITVALIGAPWLKELTTSKKNSSALPLSTGAAPLPTPSVAVAPADPLVVRLIEGLQRDLQLAKEAEQRLISQRIADVAKIATLSSELEDCRRAARRAEADMMMARRLENDMKEELLELRAKVKVLTERMAALPFSGDNI